MIKVNEEDRKFIIENLGESFLNVEDADTVLDALTVLMQREGFDSNDDINDFGWEAQKVYDRIYFDN